MELQTGEGYKGDEHFFFSFKRKYSLANGRLRLFEKKEKDAISNAADDFIRRSIQKQFPETEGTKVYEVKRSFFYHHKGQYGVYSESYILSRLSNGSILAFEFKIYPPSVGEGLSLCEVFPPKETDNEEHIKAVTPQLRYLSSKIKLSSQSKLNLLTLVILITGLALFAVLFWLACRATFYFLTAVVAYSICLWRYTKVKNKRARNNLHCAIEYVVLFPLYAWRLFIKPAIPIVAGLIALLVVAGLIPMFVIVLLNEVIHIGLSWNTIFYILFTVGSILCVHGSWLVHWGEKKVLSHLIKRHGTPDEEIMVDLALYAVQKNTIKFIIYLVYVILISVMGFWKIQYDIPLFGEETDYAILTSFAVFIAYTNMIAKSQEVEISSEELLHKMMKVILSEEESERQDTE